MPILSSPELITVTITGVFSVIVAYLVWRRRPMPGATSFSALMLVVALWLSIYAARLAFPQTEANLLLVLGEYIGFLFIPTLWLLFSIAFTGRQRRLKPITITLLAIEPVVVFALLWFNLLSTVVLQAQYAYLLPEFLDPPYSIVEGFHLFYSYILMLSGSIILIENLTRSYHAYRGQAFTILAGVLFPWIGHLLDLFVFTAPNSLQLTPIAFGVSGLFFAVGILHYRLVNLIPVAREIVFEQISDGVLVLDLHDRLVDVNRSAIRLMNLSIPQDIGKIIREILPVLPDDILPLSGVSEINRSLVIRREGDPRHFDLHITPLKEKKQMVGRVIILRDTTQSRQDAITLQRRDAVLEAISFSANQFLKGSSWEQTIDQVVTRLGQATNACRALIFECQYPKPTPQPRVHAAQSADITHQPQKTNLTHACLRFEWVNQATPPRKDNPGLQDFTFQEASLQRWETMLSRGETIQSLSTSVADREHNPLIAPDVRSFLIVPIFSGETWWGFMGFDECTYERQWTAVEIDVLKAAANTFGGAIQREHYEEMLRHRTEVISTLLNVAEIMGSTLDVSQVLNRIVLATRNLLPVERVAVFFWDAERDLLTPALPTGSSSQFALLTEEEIKQFINLRLAPAQAPLIRELQEKKIAIAVNDARESQMLSQELVQAFTIRSFLAIPIINQNGFLGILYADLTSDTHNFTPEEIDLGMTLARQAALALDRARLYENSQQYADELASIYHASTQLLKPGSDHKTLAEQIAQAIKQEFPDAFAEVLIVDRDTQELRLLAHSDPKYMDLSVLPLDGPGLTVAAVKSGEIIYAPDVSRDSRYLQAYAQTKSELVFPLHYGGSVIGILNLESPKQDAFDERARRIMTTFSEDAALAMQNVRLFNAANIHARQVAMLNELTRSAIEKSDLKDIAEAMASHMCELINADDCFINLWNEEKLVFDGSGGSKRLKNAFESFPREPGQPTFSEDVIRENHPIVINDISSSPYISARVAAHFNVSNALAVPLVGSDQIHGVVVVSFRQPHHFTPKEISLCSQAAGQVALAIGRARSLEIAQQRAQEAETLRQAGAIVAATLDRNEAIHLILEQLSRVVEYDSASVQLLGDGYLEIVGGIGWPQKDRVLGIRFPVPGENPNSIVIENSAPYILKNAPDAYPTFRTDPHNHIRSWMGVPLIVHDRIIGMLAIDSTKPDFYNQDHARLATAFADQVAIIIENARLYEEARQAAERRAILYRASQEIVAAKSDTEQIYKAIHEATLQLMPSDAFVITLHDENKREMVAVYAIDRDERLQKESRLPDTVGMGGKVIANGESIFINDVSREKDFYVVHLDQHENTGSFIAVPLKLGGLVIGLLSTQSYEPYAYSLEDQRLLEMLAAHAAIAIENSRLFKELEWQAITDPGTGLYNRRGLFEFGRREIERSRRFHRPLSAVMIDIDFFKNVNDRYGHNIGDHVLHDLAETCRASIREIDLIGRYGGEEFVILLPETDLNTGRQIAERLRQGVENSVYKYEEIEVSITISLGVASFSKKTTDLSSLIDLADQAMYQSKQSGRNCVSLAEK